MSTQKIFVCQDCGRSFGSQSALNMHMGDMARRKDHVPRGPVIVQKRPGMLRRLFRKIFRRS